MKTTILVLGFAVALGSVTFAGQGAKPTRAATVSAPAKKTVKGDRAKTWMRALKLAGVKPTKKKDKLTFKVASISCRGHLEDPDVFGSCECQLDKRTAVDAAAVYLDDAMSAAGLFVDGGLMKTLTQAENVECDYDNTRSPDELYRCIYSPIGGDE